MPFDLEIARGDDPMHYCGVSLLHSLSHLWSAYTCSALGSVGQSPMSLSLTQLSVLGGHACLQHLLHPSIAVSIRVFS